MKNQEKPKGLVIIYTGEGKGKTTAALGLALRAAGYKKKVLIVQFGKASYSGEQGIVERMPEIKIVQGGRGFMGILGDRLPKEEHQKATEEAFSLLKQEIEDGDWDIIIADELVGTLYAGLLKEKEVLSLIHNKPEKLDLVLTGRGATPSLIEAADLVTEMKKIKHPFEKGFTAKKGVDY